MAVGTITAAQRDEVVQIQDREFQRWTVEIDLGDERINTDVLRRPESPDPTGQPAYSEEKNGRVRWKVGTGAFGGGGNGGGRGRSPADTKAIQRQHSQEMALRYAAIQNQRGKLPDSFALDTLKPIIDWFEKDIAGEQA